MLLSPISENDLSLPEAREKHASTKQHKVFTANEIFYITDYYFFNILFFLFSFGICCNCSRNNKVIFSLYNMRISICADVTVQYMHERYLTYT